MSYKYGHHVSKVKDELAIYLSNENDNKIEKIQTTRKNKSIYDELEIKARISISEKSKVNQIKAVITRAAVGKKLPENYKYEFLSVKTLEIKPFTPGLVFVAAKHTDLTIIFYDRKAAENFLTFDNASRIMNNQSKLQAAKEFSGKIVSELYSFESII